MATTRLTDVYTPTAFDMAVQLMTTTKNELWQSGLVVPNDFASLVGADAASTFHLPYDNDLGNEEPNIGSDDPGDTITAKKTDGDKMIVIKNFHNQAWSEADLAAQLHHGEDPLDKVANRVGAYVNRDYQRVIVKSLTGILADNIANDGNDMIEDISNDSSDAVSAAEKVSIEAAIDAIATSGDKLDMFTDIFMHSVVYHQAKKNNLIDTVPDAEQGRDIERFANLRVHVDDGVNTITGSNRTKYDTYLTGPGLFQYAPFEPRTPSEIDREPGQGGGEGVETLYYRWHFMLHPVGFDFVAGGISGQSPTYSELAAAAQWDRKWDRKLIPFAALRTNG